MTILSFFIFESISMKWGQFVSKQEIGCKRGLQYTPRNVQLFEYS